MGLSRARPHARDLYNRLSRIRSQRRRCRNRGSIPVRRGSPRWERMARRINWSMMEYIQQPVDLRDMKSISDLPIILHAYRSEKLQWRISKKLSSHSPHSTRGGKNAKPIPHPNPLPQPPPTSAHPAHPHSSPLIAPVPNIPITAQQTLQDQTFNLQ